MRYKAGRVVREADPCGCVTRGAAKRADVGSELSAAGGRGSEVSEWPRSKFSASAVRQRKNFGHRNRIIGPYGSATRGAMGGRPRGSPLRRVTRSALRAGGQGRPPLRKRTLRCVGEGLCPSHGRGRTPPLRKRYKRCEENGPMWASASTEGTGCAERRDFIGVFKFVKKLSCLFGAVAVQCFRRFFASKFALHPG